jgi:hypothetical protein
MPPVTRATDVAPIRAEIAARCPGVQLVELGYSDAYPVLAGIGP